MHGFAFDVVLLLSAWQEILLYYISTMANLIFLTNFCVDQCDRSRAGAAASWGTTTSPEP